jgi:hypothetical protein
VEELRGKANGRGDLLAEQAGLMIDAVSVRPGDSGVPGRGQIADCGPAPRRTSSPGWVEIGRQRGLNRSPAF